MDEVSGVLIKFGRKVKLVHYQEIEGSIPGNTNYIFVQTCRANH